MTEEDAMANRLFLFKVAVMRHEYTDWPDGGDDIELMRGEVYTEPETHSIDLGWFLTVAVWVLVAVLSAIVTKKLVAS